jgi:hypothetical protein
MKRLLDFAAIPSPVDHIAYTAGDSTKLKPLTDTTVQFVQEVSLVRSMVPIILAKLALAYVPSSLESSLTLI